MNDTSQSNAEPTPTARRRTLPPISDRERFIETAQLIVGPPERNERIRDGREAPASEADRPAATTTLGAEAATDDLRRDVGFDQIEVVETSAGEAVAVDYRGDEHFDPRKLEGLPPVVEQIARGKLGVTSNTTTGRLRGNRNLVETTVLTPVTSALLEPGDGAAEVVLADMTTSATILGGRVAEQLSYALDGLARPETVQRLGSAYASIMKGAAVTVMALAKVRQMRRDWEREVRVTRDEAGDGDQIVVKLRAAH